MARQGLRLEDFDLAATISKGSFGTVYKAVRKADGRVFALKQVKLKGMKRVDREEAIDEARVLSQLHHPHITQHHGSFIDKDEQLNILMEYAANGSLHARIRACGPGKALPEAQVWKYIIQALLGLSYVHSRKIIHRDIKSLNLFLDSSDNIKIGDLGIARSLSGGSDFAHTLLGTPYYLSPELSDDKPYNEKSDVWALGVVLYECCMSRYPFEAQNEGALIRKILRGTFTPISGPYSPGLVQLAGAMLTFNPARRPNAAQLLQMPAVVSQARALGIDMACRTPRPSDPPVYEKGAAGQGAQQLQQQRHSSNNEQQQQHDQRQFDRPLSGAQAAAAGAQGGKHPFDMPAAIAAAMPAGRQPAQGQQQQYGVRAYPGDAAAIAELQQMMEGAGVGFNRQQQQTEQVPAAGYQAARPGSACAAAPFAVAGSCILGKLANTTSAQEAAAAVWTVKHAPPQFGRKRCPDLMATGPSLRGSGGGGSRGVGYAAPVADDATSYCTTSYQPTSYH